MKTPLTHFPTLPHTSSHKPFTCLCLSIPLRSPDLTLQQVAMQPELGSGTLGNKLLQQLCRWGKC